ncbi:MAG: type IV secretion system protein, partial [Candidatus Margulisbacteria bacterium]|nr:type IV secretion system protein [Candidatus Margulisiibacteriota bacterium]
MLITLLLIIVLPEYVFSAVNDENLLDDVVLQFRNQVVIWVPIIRTHAIRLFWLLAVIDLSWTGIKLALSSSNLSETLGEITRHILFIGFFFNLLMFSNTWAMAIVNSLQSIANQAVLVTGGDTGLSPSDIFEIGHKMVDKILAV